VAGIQQIYSGMPAATTRCKEMENDVFTIMLADIGVKTASEMFASSVERGVTAILGTTIVVMGVVIAFLYRNSQAREDKLHQDYQRLLKELQEQLKQTNAQIIENNNVLSQYANSMSSHQEQMRNMLAIHSVELVNKINEIVNKMYQNQNTKKD
jgi:uncharacterized protein YlxW (UPF0749 family)